MRTSVSRPALDPEAVAYSVLWTLFVSLATAIIVLSIFQPRLIAYGCDNGHGQLSTLYADAEDDLPTCERIELY